MQKKQFSKEKDVKGSQKSKPKKRPTKKLDSHRNDAESDYEGKKTPFHNDAGWYIPDKQILKDTCSIPFSWPTGYPFRNSGTLNLDTQDSAVTGILSQGVMPTIGNAKNPEDAVNVAANGLYSFVRHMNSGSKNYDAPDMMLYILAVDSMYYWISWGTRIFSTLCMYTQGNRYLPQDLLDAQSIDFADFRDNFAQFRAGMNLRIPKVATFLIPSVMPIFQRHSWLFQNYYIEGNSEKEQIYFYYPEGYYVFDYDNDGAGMLKAKFKGSNMKVVDYFQILDEMIDAVIANEDFNIMTGDIYKAYGSKILTLNLLPDMSIANLVYDETVLLQFKNAKPTDVHRTGNNLGDSWYDDFFNVHQSTNKDYLIVETPESALLGYRLVNASHTNHFVGTGGGTTDENNCLLASANIWTKKTMIVSPRHDVTPEELIESTRGSMAFYIVPDATKPYGFTTVAMFFGSEWYCGYNIYRRRRTGGTITTQRFAVERSLVWDETDVNAADYAGSSFMHFLPCLSQFKFHPELDITGNRAGGPRKNGEPIWDIDNYALLDYETLGRMHDTSIMGEFNVPKIAWSADR